MPHDYWNKLLLSGVDLQRKLRDSFGGFWPDDFLKIRNLLGAGTTADSPRYSESE